MPSAKIYYDWYYKEELKIKPHQPPGNTHTPAVPAEKQPKSH
jgi:hypothetical protein